MNIGLQGPLYYNNGYKQIPRVPYTHVESLPLRLYLGASAMISPNVRLQVLANSSGFTSQDLGNQGISLHLGFRVIKLPEPRAWHPSLCSGTHQGRASIRDLFNGEQKEAKD